MLETPNHRIVGDLYLPRGGYRSRLSDFLNREGLSFIPLVNATITPRTEGATGETREFIAVARDFVQLAYETSP